MANPTPAREGLPEREELKRDIACVMAGIDKAEHPLFLARAGALIDILGPRIAALAAIAGREAQGGGDGMSAEEYFAPLPHQPPERGCAYCANNPNVLKCGVCGHCDSQGTPPPPSDAAKGVQPVRVDEAKLIELARRAIGDHYAPDDCYATGPLTGNPFSDLVECPACAFLAAYAAHKGEGNG